MANHNYRTGFLMALAENGITPSILGNYCLTKSANQLESVELEKQALLPFLGSSMAGAAGGAAAGVGSRLASMGAKLPVDAALLPLVLAAATGGGLGYGASKLQGAAEAGGYKKELEALKQEELNREILFQNEKTKQRIAKLLESR